MAVGSNIAFALRSIMKVNLPTKVKVRNDLINFHSFLIFCLIVLERWYAARLGLHYVYIHVYVYAYAYVYVSTSNYEFFYLSDDLLFLINFTAIQLWYAIFKFKVRYLLIRWYLILIRIPYKLLNSMYIIKGSVWIKWTCSDDIAFVSKSSSIRLLHRG